MANAKRDQNDKPVALGVSSVDNTTTLMLKVDPITGYMIATVTSDSIITVGSTHKIDQNDIPTCYGVSNTDLTTLVPIRTDSNGTLLVQLT